MSVCGKIEVRRRPERVGCRHEDQPRLETFAPSLGDSFLTLGVVFLSAGVYHPLGMGLTFLVWDGRFGWFRQKGVNCCDIFVVFWSNVH